VREGLSESPTADGSARRLDVFFTIDVEVWCDGWRDIDAKFPDAFRRYIHGPTPKGQYGLPFQLRLLNESGLRAVCFVEPLFAMRFGSDPLAEIVALVRDAGHEPQLHLHTEWVDEARVPLFPGVTGKRQYLRQFSLAEQSTLIKAGRKLLAQAGAPDVAAFRAGSFGFNRDTLRALQRNGMSIDSSYNATMFGPDSGVMTGGTLYDVALIDEMLEFPMTVFQAGSLRPRHVQLGACSYAEIEGLLWRALEAGQRSFVILSHNFELLNPSQTGVDEVVVNRLRRLCAFFGRNTDSFYVRGFDGLDRIAGAGGGLDRPLTSPLWQAGTRTLEQIYRRRYR